MANEKIDVTDLDLVITRIEKRTSSGGAWVRGKINNAVRFEALVFAEHAEIQVVVDFLGCGLADLVWGS